MLELENDYLVSVCIITYNHAEYISECLESILKQKTNFKFNIFISDDCSTDETFKILLEYAAKYENISVFSRCGLSKSTVNGKPTGNLNLMENLARMTGEFVAMCDGDDVWNNDSKLQIQVDLLKANPDVAFVCSARNKIINGTFFPNKLVLPDLNFSYRWLCLYNPIPSSSVVTRKVNLKKQPEWYFSEIEVGDWPLWFSLARNQRILKLSKAYIDYRVHSAGAWGRMKKSDKCLSALKAVRILKRHYGEKLFILSNCLHFLRYQFFKTLEEILAKKNP